MNNKISMFLHCAKCVHSVPDGESPQSWARLSVGWTPKGLQVWCNRHDESVMALDFLGQKVAYDADTTDGHTPTGDVIDLKTKEKR